MSLSKSVVRNSKWRRIKKKEKNKINTNTNKCTPVWIVWINVSYFHTYVCVLVKNVWALVLSYGKDIKRTYLMWCLAAYKKNEKKLQNKNKSFYCYFSFLRILIHSVSTHFKYFYIFSFHRSIGFRFKIKK